MVTSDRFHLEQLGILWDRVSARLVGAVLAVLAATLRLIHVNADGYSLDEVFSIWMARHSAREIVLGIWLQGTDPTPPIYYLSLHALLQLGETPLIVRAVSLVAGSLMVWVAFHIAADLFDLRVATLGGLLLAMAPFHIEYSLTARAYVPAALWVTVATYFFVQIVLRTESHRWHWIGFVLAAVLAVCTHYLAAFSVIAFNAAVLLLWVCRRLSRSRLMQWIGSQIVLGLLLLPVVISALRMMVAAQEAERWTWITQPGLAELIKSVILFSVGDPSYGGAAVTPARLVALAALGLLGLLGVWIVLRRRQFEVEAGERDRVLMLACFVLVIWAVPFAISQVKPIYKEKYVIYLMPPLLTLMAWIFVRARAHVVAPLLLIVIVGLTGRSLYVYYTSPSGEQWREAIEYLQAQSEPGDLIVLSPGFYVRPFAYYTSGEFPPETAALSEVPAVVVTENGMGSDLPALDELAGARGSTAGPLSAHPRIWLVYGYSDPDPSVEAWLDDSDLHTVQENEFLGASVALLQRAPSK